MVYSKVHARHCRGSAIGTYRTNNHESVFVGVGLGWVRVKDCPAHTFKRAGCFNDTLTAGGKAGSEFGTLLVLQIPKPQNKLALPSEGPRDFGKLATNVLDKRNPNSKPYTLNPKA